MQLRYFHRNDKATALCRHCAVSISLCLIFHHYSVNIYFKKYFHFFVSTGRFVAKRKRFSFVLGYGPNDA